MSFNTGWHPHSGWAWCGTCFVGSISRSDFFHYTIDCVPYLSIGQPRNWAHSSVQNLIAPCFILAKYTMILCTCSMWPHWGATSWKPDIIMTAMVISRHPREINKMKHANEWLVYSWYLLVCLFMTGVVQFGVTTLFQRWCIWHSVLALNQISIHRYPSACQNVLIWHHTHGPIIILGKVAINVEANRPGTLEPELLLGFKEVGDWLRVLCSEGNIIDVDSYVFETSPLCCIQMSSFAMKGINPCLAANQ